MIQPYRQQFDLSRLDDLSTIMTTLGEAGSFRAFGISITPLIETLLSTLVVMGRPRRESAVLASYPIVR